MPALSASSISRRCARASEPWCARTSGSPASSLSARGEALGDAPAVDEEQRRAVRADQLEQARVNGAPDASGAPGPATSGRSGSSIGSPMRAMSSTGTSMRSSSAFFAPASTMVTGRNGGRRARCVRRRPSSGSRRAAPDRSGRCAARGARRLVPPTARRRGTAPPRRAGAASPTGRCAASGRPQRCSSRSSESARCAPRLVGTSAWISSTMTVSTERSASRLFDVRSR